MYFKCNSCNSCSLSTLFVNLNKCLKLNKLNNQYTIKNINTFYIMLDITKSFLPSIPEKSAVKGSKASVIPKFYKA